MHAEKGPAPPPPPMVTPPASPLTPPITPPSTSKPVGKDIGDAAPVPPPPPVLPPEPRPPEPKPPEPQPPEPGPSEEPEPNIVVVQPTPDPEILVVPPARDDIYKQNTSTITITSSNPELSDAANSLASNISQVTVVTTHPPILVDNSYGLARFVDSSEVVIVANETNKTQINESSTDEECFPSLDSLECPPPKEFKDDPVVKESKVEGQKLDESEVLIVNSSFVSLGDSGLDGTLDNSRLLDTSHVSVVTVGEDKVKVKDSASVVYDHGTNPPELLGSTSDLSIGRSSKSDSGDEMRHAPHLDDKLVNGNVLRTNIHNTAVKNFAESRSQSENSSVRSSSSHPSRASKSVDHSDVESISTASQDSRGKLLK